MGKARTINEQGDFMLNSVTAKAVIDHALFLGADFAELFVEHHQTNTVQIASGEVDKVNSGIDFGIGIRLFFGHKVLYGYTNSTDEALSLIHI